MDCSLSIPDVGESVLSQPDTSILSDNEYQSREEKIELRRSYRKLIQETQDNKEELVKPDNNGLMENIAKAEVLFQRVKEAREGALDSRFMSLAVSLGAQKTSLLQTDLVAFQPDEFVEKLITFMGGSVVGDADEVNIPDACWDSLGKKVTPYFTSIVPALHTLSGAFERSEQTNSQAVKRQRANKDVLEKAQLPQHVTNYRNDSKEATPAEIERVYNQIRRMCLQESSIDYFELVINPRSYGHTIENIFHLAFLVKDGLVSISLNESGLPVVELVKDISSQSHSDSQATSTSSNHQAIVSLSYDEWAELVKAFDLTGREPCISPSEAFGKDLRSRDQQLKLVVYALRFSTNSFISVRSDALYLCILSFVFRYKS